MAKAPKSRARGQINRIKAYAYLRTSSAANTGDDKDSDKRQMQAILQFADRNGYEIAGSFYDAAVSGADAIDQRPGFNEMLRGLATNGCKTIIVETANRFARDLIVQETGYQHLTGLGFTLIAADSPHSFVEETPTAILIRQILGAVAQFDKSMTVAKLKGARERKARELGVKTITGRRAMAGRYPEATAMAKQLAHGNRKEKLSFRQIAARLAEAGHVNKAGKPYGPSAVRRMIQGPEKKVETNDN